MKLKQLSCGIFAALLLIVSTGVSYAQEKAEKAESENPYIGAYSVKSGTRAGAEVDAERLPPEITIDEKNFTVPSPDGKFVMAYSLKEGTSPLQVDMKIVEGPAVEATSLGILKMEDNRVTLCYDPTGQSRPEDFTSTEDNGFHMFVMDKSGGAKFMPEKMVGDWAVVMGERAGAEVPDDRRPPQINISEDMFTIPAGPDMTFKMSYTVNADSDPVEIDMEMAEGPQGAAVGIVKFEDGNFFLCYDPTGQTRPESFETDEDNGFFLFELEPIVD